MSEMVERVARAICANTNIAMEGQTEVIFDNPDYVIPANKRTDGKSVARWELYVPQANAAIEAMREPTSEMLLGEPCMAGGKSYMVPVLEIWPKMIDAALKT